MNEALIADPVRSKQILERIPAGRWGTAEDFEGAIVFLASRASDYVSGECLVVDGGWMGSECFSSNSSGVKLIFLQDRSLFVHSPYLRLLHWVTLCMYDASSV
jgi:hypothetical protein